MLGCAQFFGRRGVFSRLRGKTPELTTAFGEQGILEDTVGHMPPVVEAMGEVGVLQATRGPTPAWALQQEAEERNQSAKSERDALAIAAFIESHSDAQLLPGGKVRCETTGHEMPLDMYWLTSHWEGKKYAKVVARGAKQAEAAKKAHAKLLAISPIFGTDEAVAAAGKDKAKKKEKKRLAKLEKQMAIAKEQEAAAHFPSDGSVRWTSTAVTTSNVALSPEEEEAWDLERWSMDDVAKVQQAKQQKEKKAPSSAGRSSRSSARKLAAPPPGLPPLPYGLVAPPVPPSATEPAPPVGPRNLAVGTPVASTPVGSDELAWERRAEHARAMMATPGSEAPPTPVAAQQQQQQDKKAIVKVARKKIVATPMANKKASTMNSMAMDALVAEDGADADASSIATTGLTDVREDGSAKAGDWARLFGGAATQPAAATASHEAPDVSDAEQQQPTKPSAYDWARVFKAERAVPSTGDDAAAAPVVDAAPVADEVIPPSPAGPAPAELDEPFSFGMPPAPPMEPKPAEVKPAAEKTVEAEAPPTLSEAAVKAMKVVELRAALEERGLATDGLKPALATRLLQAVTDAEPASVDTASAEPLQEKAVEPPQPLEVPRSSRRAAGTASKTPAEVPVPSSGRASRSSARNNKEN